MNLKVGDLVTRKSYNNDTIFVIENINDDICELKGVIVRLYADADISDLEKYDGEIKDDSKDFYERIKENFNLDRNNYFYLPGKILHIDGDELYLKKCLKYYEECNLMAVGELSIESETANNIRTWLEEYNPSIVVITGHDAFYKNENRYKNSSNFVASIKEARKFEKSHEKLIIIAGACQSNYEDLIRAGANFASSPKRVNIHALDPAIIAANMALSDVNTDIDLKKILDSTKYKTNGIGGIKTKGTMYVGYPR
ncbi:MAG: sporulation peptidase YabG [Bacillales bacterium]|nr:sporulation peptidase YabG [Bacillales bacterium]